MMALCVGDRTTKKRKVKDMEASGSMKRIRSSSAMKKSQMRDEGGTLS